jgi:hypothetical protein
MKEGAGARTEQAKQGAQEAGAKTQEHAQARAALFCLASSITLSWRRLTLSPRHATAQGMGEARTRTSHCLA